MENLEFCKLNLLNDNGWVNAVRGCDYMIHLASPVNLREPNEERELIEPAVKGTLRALNAAASSKIKKVVLTSSIAAIVYGNNKKIYSNNDWSETDKNIGAYAKSKTLAEKAAWNFVNDGGENKSFVLTTINPGMVFGPMLGDNYKVPSVSLIQKIISVFIPFLPNACFTTVDVGMLPRYMYKH